MGFLFLLALLLIEPADIVLVDIDNTADDVAVALSGKAVIHDGECVFKNAAGKDGMPEGISIVWTTKITPLLFLLMISSLKAMIKSTAKSKIKNKIMRIFYPKFFFDFSIKIAIFAREF